MVPLGVVRDHFMGWTLERSTLQLHSAMPNPPAAIIYPFNHEHFMGSN